MAGVNELVSISVQTASAAVARENMNVCCVITQQQTGPIDSATRYKIYRDALSVETDFGSSSDMTAHALAFFGTSPNPIGVNGLFVAGYWRGAEEVVAASAAYITGAALTESTTIAALQAISAGSMTLTVDGVTVALTALDFRAVTTLAGAIAVIQAGIDAGDDEADVTVNSSNQIVITSATTGASSLITLPVVGAEGTFIGTILGLATGTGAVAVQGAASATLAVETKSTCVAAIKAVIDIKDFVFIDAVSDADRALLGAWCQANKVFSHDVVSAAANLVVGTTNVVWANKLAGYKNYRFWYSATANKRLATAAMARAHTVDFNAENSAMTLQCKTLGVAAEDHSTATIAAAKAVGLDLYAIIAQTPCVLLSGANGYFDDQYNIIGFANAVQTDMFNLLNQTSTKVPQTQAGVSMMLDQLDKTTRPFVRAGVIAPGTWTNTDFIGDYDGFIRAIEQEGYRWVAGELADQPVADRADRKSVVLQGAVKFAGAVHSISILLNVNL